MTLEEYIIRRKKEDGINEYDMEKRMENTRICVNYVFEYFNNYLETKPADEKTTLHEQKVDKYRHRLREYENDVKEWLVSLYSSYGKYMHKQLMNLISDDYFLLYDTEAEFRALSYDVYSNAVKKFKFLEGQSEMIFLFVKEAHRINSLLHSYDSDFYISESINEWIYNTYRKYGVNLYNFCMNWVEYYYDCPDKWPKGHKKKSEYYDKYKGNTSFGDSLRWDYDYKQKSNLFGLDDLYRKMPKKSFIKGRKQEFEATLLYCWLHNIETDDEYWYEYSQNVL